MMVLVRGKRRHINAHLRFAVLSRDRFRCVYCGATASETQLQLDHIVSIRRGGKDEMGNLVTACLDCNIGKNASEVERPKKCPRCNTLYWDRPRRAR